MGKKNGIKRKTDFKLEKGEIFKNNKRDITIIDMEIRPRYNKDGSFKCNDKWYKYHCNIDKYEGWLLESDLLTRKRGCKLCSGHAHVLGNNTIWDTDPWMIPIVGEEIAKKYSHGSNFEVCPQCPDCGQIKNKKMSISTICRYHSMNCNCSEGIKYPNKFAFDILTQLQVSFITEYNPNWIKPRLYDFYFKLNDKEYVLEMDGGLGHGKVIHSKSKLSKEESKLIDDYKDEQARLHGIEMIRIDCDYDSIENRFEFIKNNILDNKYLNRIFELSKINWDKCNEYALSNLIKKACELWSNGIHSTKEIGKIMNFRSDTIIDWLKQGSGIWCDYDPKEEMRKNASKNRILKQVEIFKDNISLGIFPSASELVRCSLELFGVKLSISKISLVCNGKRKLHQGFTFEFV